MFLFTGRVLHSNWLPSDSTQRSGSDGAKEELIFMLHMITF